MENKGKKKTTPEENTTKTANKGSNIMAVEFSFDAPDAKEVCLAGTFNNWDVRAIPMKNVDGKGWRAKISLAPGRYEYKYRMDGVWVEDVPGAEKIPNAFGTYNFSVQVT